MEGQQLWEMSQKNKRSSEVLLKILKYWPSNSRWHKGLNHFLWGIKGNFSSRRLEDLERNYTCKFYFHVVSCQH